MNRSSRWPWAITIVALIYSGLHFAESGVRFPLNAPNLGKFDEETPPLRDHLLTGLPVRVNNSVQYGPVFFFVMHPLLRVSGGNPVVLALWLYALQMLCLAGAFAITLATLRRFTPVGHQRQWPMIAVWLAIVWLNFAPLLAIIAVKSVETWELFLISLALWAHLHGQRWGTAVSLAAASLIKFLPLMFVAYLLFVDWRTFAYTCMAIFGLLLVGHALYGPDMGLAYFWWVFGSVTGESYGLTWHENISLKAMIAKALGHLDMPATEGPLAKTHYVVVLTPGRLMLTSVIGDLLEVTVFGWLAWRTWVRSRLRPSPDRTLWAWSLTAVVLLIIAPNSTFEYATLVLGAVSYAVVRILGRSREPFTGPLAITDGCFVAALFLMGGLMPRVVVNRLTFVDALNRWTGYGAKLTPSEGFQYYGFPLLALILLAVAIWRLEPRPNGRAQALIC